MDLLKAEMARKRKALQLAKEQTRSGNNNISGKKKKKRQFLKAGQLKQFMEEQEEEERDKGKKKDSFSVDKEWNQSTKNDKQKDNNNNNNNNNKRGIDSNKDDKDERLKETSVEKGKKRNKNDSSGRKKSGDELSKKKKSEGLSLDDIVSALRSMGLPIRLFGEDLDDIRQRLDKSTLEYEHMRAGKSEQSEFLLDKQHRPSAATTGKQQQQQQLLLKQQRKQQPIQKQGTNNTNPKKKNTLTPKQREELLKYIEPQNNDITTTTTTTTTNEKTMKEDEDSRRLIYNFFKALLLRWELDLEKRSEDICSSSSGIREMRTFKQCQDYIRPLFQSCRTNQLEDNIVAPLKKIVDFARSGEFVKAHDAYMDVAIGRSAWPIGVTMVGIHARSGRAKIESANVAHVMNSELQRKYLTSIKRLLSYYQNIRTDVPPSKKVLNT